MGAAPPAVAAALLLLLRHACAGAPSSDCSVPLKSLSERPPLLLRPEGPLNVSGFAAPDADGVLRMSVGAPLLLACPGARNQLLFNNRSTGLQQVEATCVRGAALRAPGGAWVDARRVACAAHAERVAEAEADGRRRCGARDRGVRVRVGFRLLSGFVELLGACFDADLLSPIYSNYTLVHAIAGKRPGGERAIFRTGGVFGPVSPRRQYEQQNATLQALLGVGEAFSANDSLTRGHLASRAGFVFWPQKRATFFYVNAAPQWRSVNAGAWAAVELAGRNLAAARGDLLVVTGVYGVAALDDALGRPVSLYLYVGGGVKKMPVPALYWKVLYDNRTGEGAAIVATNNPFQPLSARPELLLCPDVCDLLRWLPLTPANRSQLYCCEVDALRRRVDDLPPLEVRGLLKTATPARQQVQSAEPGGATLTGWEALLAADAAFSPVNATANYTSPDDMREVYNTDSRVSLSDKNKAEAVPDRRVASGEGVSKPKETEKAAGRHEQTKVKTKEVDESGEVEYKTPVLAGWQAILKAEAEYSPT